MAALIEIFVKSGDLDKMVQGCRDTGSKGVSITLSVEDTANQWNKNVSGYISQTKAQREAKAARTFVAGGRVIWNDGKVVNAPRDDKQS